jgi:myosin-5
MGTPGSELEPHVFAVADRSYRQMMQEQRKSQSILISGESGAGKTESTKIVMLYLTTLGNMGMENNEEEGGELSVMQKVLQSNPVLEAFGNARTLRNDNSSRFGKFIELGFTRAGHLIGAKVQTYLLEKVRLAFHASGERNYHIFYQLLRGASDEEKLKYEFNDGDTGGMELPMYYHFTGQGGAPHLREFTDESGLEYTLKAMKNLGWTQETIDSVLSLIAGIIHLGQVSFNKKMDDASGLEIAEVADVKTLELCSRLMGVDVEKMTTALTERVIVARGQEIKTQLTVDKAVDARDALAKTIYGALFLWVVDQVNQSISWEKDEDVRSSVGVLDIFGFECFSINSFEQLCINFTNEALQQQFNKFIFKLEQAEYEAEEIEWAFISFPDNQDCLDTIQKAKTGILSMLDDECRLPKGSDRNWAKRMYEQYLPEKNQTVSENTRFIASKVQQGKSLFCVRHFAGNVEYSAETNFMEKNKDEIPLTAQNMFETAPSQLVKNMYDIQKKETEGRKPDESAAGKPGRKPASKTVGQQFKEQLHSLIDSVSKTDPHYIRCLKPNDAAKPKMLTRKRMTEQLRYGGVLEAVRVARAGYPVRLVHEQFFQRYRMLLPTTPADVLPWNMEGRGAQELCVKLLDCVLAEGNKHKEATVDGPLDPNAAGISRSEKIRRMQRQPVPLLFPKTDVQLGKTKVFMRKPPHDVLEAHRVFQQHASATIIQCWVRGLMQEKRFLEIQGAVRLAQRFYRGCKGRERCVVPAAFDISLSLSLSLSQC